MNLYVFAGNFATNVYDVLGHFGETPQCRPKWPELSEEGMPCDVPPAKIKSLTVNVTIKTPKIGSIDYVAVKASIDWDIEGVYLGPRWNYSTCDRSAPQTNPDPLKRHGGQIPWCDDGDCEFNACDPQLLSVHFHFLSCECEWAEDGKPTGRTVWTRKRYFDTGTVEGDLKSTGWHWQWLNPQKFQQDRSDWIFTGRN